MILYAYIQHHVLLTCYLPDGRGLAHPIRSDDEQYSGFGWIGGESQSTTDTHTRWTMIGWNRIE